MSCEAVVMGASAGGISAIKKLVGGLAPSFPAPVIVVQHLPADSRIPLTDVFGTDVNTKEAEDKERPLAGCIYHAPPGYHLLIERDRSFSLSMDDPVNLSRPSIDLLFESAARAYGPSLVGILLTGANHDGARGLREIKLRGGQTLVQDPRHAEVPTMPKAALELFQPDHTLDLDGILRFLQDLEAA